MDAKERVILHADIKNGALFEITTKFKKGAGIYAAKQAHYPPTNANI